jgi:hypothetical protein
VLDSLLGQMNVTDTTCGTGRLVDWYTGSACQKVMQHAPRRLYSTALSTKVPNFITLSKGNFTSCHSVSRLCCCLSVTEHIAVGKNGNRVSNTKRPLGKPTSRWKYNTIIDVREIVYGSVSTELIWLRMWTGGGLL